MNLIFKHKEEENKGSFLFYDEETLAAEMTYSKGGDFIIIDHTSVEANYRSRDLGYRLVDKMVEHARENNIKVMPLCPFTASVFQKNEEIRDVLK